MSPEEQEFWGSEIDYTLFMEEIERWGPLSTIYAGSYLDKSQQRLHIVVLDKARALAKYEGMTSVMYDTLIARIQSAFKHEDITLETAKYTYRELFITLDIITESMPSFRDITSIWIDEKDNRIVVNIFHIDEAKIRLFKTTVTNADYICFNNAVDKPQWAVD
jgi:hypothetical protein